MELDKWVAGFKVRAFRFVDGKRIYFNVQYFSPGQSISKPPVWDKTVYITDNELGNRLVYNFTDSLVRYVSRMQVSSGAEINITA